MSIPDYQLEQILSANPVLALEPCHQSLSEADTYHIPLGSRLPLFNNYECRIDTRKFSYTGRNITLLQPQGFAQVVQYALKYLNAPYQWGGRSPFGIDCSALVQMAFLLAGYSLPRDSQPQSNLGIRVPKFEDHKTGDLAFFCSPDDANLTITHVGIITNSKAQLIHAYGMVRIDSFTKAGIVNQSGKGLSHRLVKIKRFGEQDNGLVQKLKIDKNEPQTSETGTKNKPIHRLIGKIH